MKNGRPGWRFCTAFQKRHADAISFKKPNKQEAKRYYATNAHVLTAHFARGQTTTVFAQVERSDTPIPRPRRSPPMHALLM